MTDSTQWQDLFARWRAGDEHALAELLKSQLGWLRGYVRRRLGPHLRVHDDSVDFVQQALADLLARDDTVRLDDESAFRALLARIVDNDLRDRNKWLKRSKRDPDREAGDAGDTEVGGAAFHEVTTPSIAADRRESADWMRRALEELPEVDREVIRLHEWDRLSYPEIGERLGISADAARVRFQRALPKLALKVAELRRRPR